MVLLVISPFFGIVAWEIKRDSPGPVFYHGRRAGRGGGATAPLPNFSSYAASKAGLARLAETLAEELKPFNIQVNVIAPGMVDTRLQDEVLQAGNRAGGLYEKIKLARETGKGAVSPEIAADLAVFLASEASGKLTGKLIAAPYDPWREWEGKGDELNATPMYTLRRLDPLTIKPLIGKLEVGDGEWTTLPPSSPFHFSILNLKRV
ncbi:MAG: SDR family oxidoreductase [Chloroflexota bacterium]